MAKSVGVIFYLMNFRRFIGVALFFLGAIPAWSQQESTAETMNPFAGQTLVGETGTFSGRQVERKYAPGESPFEKWWNGKGLLQGGGNGFSTAREAIEERGVSFQTNYRGAFLGVLASEGGSRGFYDQNIDFGAVLDVGKFSGLEGLKETVAFVNGRYRDGWPGSDANEVVMADSMFAPTSWQSGTQFRMMSFGLETALVGPIPGIERIIARAGWLQPQREFIDQPLSKLFLNTAISSGKGLVANVPFGSSFSSWGGTLELRHRELAYVKNGLFMSFPQGASTENHGLAFLGYGPNPALNGLFYMGEAGVTPQFGADRLPGRYAFGGYYYGTPEGQTMSWNDTPADGRYGFYFQADQMLFRERGSQGLRTFNLMSFAPGFAKQNKLPFYFQSGLAYEGLIPAREKDVALAALGYGAYQGGVGNPPATYSAVLELGYRWQINGWSFAQPFFQYISRPNGTNDVSNAAILGVLTGLVF